MKTYSYQAILSSDEDASYDIKFPPCQVVLPMTERRRGCRSSRACRIDLYGRAINKLSVKESLSNDIATPPVTTVQLQGAPSSSRTLLYVPSETVPPNASHLWLSVRFVSLVNENHLRNRLSMRELNA